MENSQEIWQTSINGEVYEISFEGLVEWINDGSLLPQDMVRRGNLRWIEAQKVPALHRFFNAKQFESANQVVSSTNYQAPAPPIQAQYFNLPQQPNFQNPPLPSIYQNPAPSVEKKLCVIHTDAEAKFNCETCGNNFCNECPQENICPMCGANCQTIDVPFIPPTVIQPKTPQPNYSPPPFPQPAQHPSNQYQPNQNQDVVIDDEIRRAANWCYWKAGLTVVNSLVGLTGSLWAFFLGMTLPQIFFGIADGVSQELQMKGTNGFVLIAFVLSLGCAAFMLFLGIKSKQGKKWAIIWALVIFCCDGVLYLLTIGESGVKGAIFGIGAHIIAIVQFAKAIQSFKK